MKKRILSTILAVLMLLGAVMMTACSNGTPANDEKEPEVTDNTGDKASESKDAEAVKAVGNFEVPEGGYDGSEVTIKFYNTMGTKYTDMMTHYIEEFNKLYPNIHVECTSVGSYDDVRDQISTEITVGNQPNLAYCYPDHVALYNLAGAVATLDSLIDSQIEVKRADGTTEILGLTEEQKNDFIAGYYNEGRQFGDDLMYSMPFSKSTEVLYYNKTFFEENGLTVPTTWDEMKEVCAKIKAIDPNSIPLGYDSESNWFITMCEQYGSPYTSATGDHFLFNNETNRNFVKMFREWYQAGYLTTQKLYGAYTSGLFTVQEEGKTRSYMSIGSSAGATYQRPAKGEDGKYPFEVGIATIPQVSADNKRVISQGPSVCIFKKSNPQEVVASWLFLKFLTTSVDFQAEFSMASGYVPVLKSVATNEAYAAFMAQADGGDFISALSAKVCLEQEDAYYTSPAFNGSSTARDQVGSLLTTCLTKDDGGDVDKMIQQAFEDAVSECEYQG
ncbi:MAG: extracellular solute-binding protein [Eubacteriales bacterium]|nr:extracellular solute-binding protein [Eubacteriales bacterium]MDY2982020.1 extracellular solute-binding protein [Eubacteriales bacterium]